MDVMLAKRTKIDAAARKAPIVMMEAGDLELLSDLLAIVQVNLSALELLDELRPGELVLLQILLEQQRQIKRLRARVNRQAGPLPAYEPPGDYAALLRGIK